MHNFKIFRTVPENGNPFFKEREREPRRWRIRILDERRRDEVGSKEERIGVKGRKCERRGGQEEGKADKGIGPPELALRLRKVFLRPWIPGE